MHPHHRCVPSGPALVDWLKHVRGNVEVADTASIRHLLEIHDAAGCFGEPRIGLEFLVDVALKVVAERDVLGIAAHVELLRAFRVHLGFRAGRARLRGRLLADGDLRDRDRCHGDRCEPVLQHEGLRMAKIVNRPGCPMGGIFGRRG